MTAYDMQLLATLLSAVAAIAAAIATWRAPISAARMAESLRRSAEENADSRRFRLNVFAALMQERAEIYSLDSVRSLNSIDIAFSSDNKVRESWSELYQVLNNSDTAKDSHVVDEKLRKLLKAMAENLGLADNLRLDDFARIYFPNALADERKVRSLERGEALARLSLGKSELAASSETGDGLFPPKPTI